jgi:hypothetical protein
MKNYRWVVLFIFACSLLSCDKKESEAKPTGEIQIEGKVFTPTSYSYMESTDGYGIVITDGNSTIEIMLPSKTSGTYPICCRLTGGGATANLITFNLSQPATSGTVTAAIEGDKISGSFEFMASSKTSKGIFSINTGSSNTRIIETRSSSSGYTKYEYDAEGKRKSNTSFNYQNVLTFSDTFIYDNKGLLNKLISNTPLELTNCSIDRFTEGMRVTKEIAGYSLTYVLDIDPDGNLKYNVFTNFQTFQMGDTIYYIFQNGDNIQYRGKTYSAVREYYAAHEDPEYGINKQMDFKFYFPSPSKHLLKKETFTSNTTGAVGTQETSYTYKLDKKGRILSVTTSISTNGGAPVVSTENNIHIYENI